MSKILIKNGLVIDPYTKTEEISSILIEQGKIVAMGVEDAICSQNKDITKVVDASGKWVVPSFVDLHCHIREPGFEYKETMVETLKAAAAGGYSTICVMPNLEPAIDQGPFVEHIKDRGSKIDLVDVHVIGAMTMGRNGKALAHIGEMNEAGIVALSDDGSTVMNSHLMMMVMNYAKSFRLSLVSHCEDLDLAKNGSVNMGKVSTENGLVGIPNAAEDIIIARDIHLAELTQTHLHIAHISTHLGVDMVRTAKKRGLNITAEVTPHHFTLSEDSVMGFNSNAKMNPPLRTLRDIDAIKEGLADGTIDAIATDHAPHAVQDKEREFDLAPFGIVGVETAISLGLKLVEDGVLSQMDLISKMTKTPASILPVNRKTGLVVGADANITVIDTDSTWNFNPKTMAGKATNSPFINQDLKGRAILTLNKGKIIWEV